MKKIFTFLFVAFCISTYAQTVLTPGDIAFTAYATDAPDRFAFIALIDLAGNTEIKFTDNKLKSNDSLATNEQTLVWTAPSSGISAGTIVIIESDTLQTNSSICSAGTAVGELDNLSTAGDQILAYQGDFPYSFVAGLSSTGWHTYCDTANTGNTNRTCLPSALTSGVNAISFSSESDNGYYNCSVLSGDKNTLLAAINNPANWDRSLTNQVWSNCVLTVGMKKLENNKLTMFPNPNTTGVLQFSNNVSISIYNALGSLVLQESSTKKADVSGLKNGIYFVKFSSGETLKLAINKN